MQRNLHPYRTVVPFSGFLYMVSTFVIWGDKSGAALSNPKIVLDLNDSEVSASLEVPLLSFRNACPNVRNLEHQTVSARTARTLTKSLTLQFFA